MVEQKDLVRKKEHGKKGAAMRKFMNILAAALVILAAVGCEKNENLPDNSVQGRITLSATINNLATKTSLGNKGTDGKYPVFWSIGDAIAVINNDECFEFDCDEIEENSNGIFALKSKVEYSKAFDATKPVQVIYPYDNVIFQGSSNPVIYNIPAEQIYSENSFGNGASPMWAYAENGEGVITFDNLFGAIKLQLKGTQTIMSISIKGNNNEVLSGEAIITTDTDGTSPSLTMTSENDSAKSVTLDCSNAEEGVDLNESEATEFIIALPPVTFSNGFTVTVTDKNENTYIIESSKSNTIVKSSILTMPELTIINSLALPWESMTVLPGTEYTLTTNASYADATGESLVWSSSNETVVEVDQTGKITAKEEGSATITVRSSLFRLEDECEVNVKPQTDRTQVEYPVEHKKDESYYGIVIGGVVWAPVNCGYEPADEDYKGYPYGKLYQWGRKYGQGYDDIDESYPSGNNIIMGPVEGSVGNAAENAEKFCVTSSDPYNWCESHDSNMWGAAKTAYDPCPEGWRVPTKDELELLKSNRSSWTQDSNGHWGYYFSGEYTYIEGAPRIFLPAAGYRTTVGNAEERNETGLYWSSTPYDERSYRLLIRKNSIINIPVSIEDGYRANGVSVRCVQIQE